MLRTLAQTQLTMEYLHRIGKETRHHPRNKGEHAIYCARCEVEVWNLLFVAELPNGKLLAHCLDCARREDAQLLAFTVLNQYRIEELQPIYDAFRLHPVSSEDRSSNLLELLDPN